MHLKSRDDDDTAEGAKLKWAQMQAQMDAANAAMLSSKVFPNVAPIR